MEEGRYVFARAKPDESIFDMVMEDEPEKDNTIKPRSKKNTDADSDFSSSDESSSEEEYEIGANGCVRMLTKKRRSPEKAKGQKSPKQLQTDKKNSSKVVNAIELSDDSDSDSDAPLGNMEEITNADPAIRKARESQALLLKKRQEVLEEQKRFIETEYHTQQNSLPLPAPKDFISSESSSDIAKRLIASSASATSEAISKQNSTNTKTKQGVKLIFRIQDSSNPDSKPNETEWIVDPNSAFKSELDDFTKNVLKRESRTGIRFVFDGEAVPEDETANDLDMEEHDIIDVKL